MAANVTDPPTEGTDVLDAAEGAPARVVITMRDIAAVAGVSQSTVSRVLNDAPTQVPIAAEDA